jgi:hypothetical protein
MLEIIIIWKTDTTFVSTYTQTDKNDEILEDKSQKQSVSEFIFLLRINKTW